MGKVGKRYHLFVDEPNGYTLGYEGTYDRANAIARRASETLGVRVQVSLNARSGRVLSAYNKGREVFYTYAGGREF